MIGANKIILQRPEAACEVAACIAEAEASADFSRLHRAHVALASPQLDCSAVKAGKPPAGLVTERGLAFAGPAYSASAGLGPPD
jgi:hypothetical protein